MHRPTPHVKTNHTFSAAPPRIIEYGYFFSIFYVILGVPLGISITLLGFGLLTILAGLCILRAGSRIFTIYKPLVFPLTFGIFFIALQLFFHGESLMERGYLRSFVPWMLNIIIVYPLTLRKGFLNRFALVALAVGLLALTFMAFQGGGFAADRLGLDRASGV